MSELDDICIKCETIIPTNTGAVLSVEVRGNSRHYDTSQQTSQASFLACDQVLAFMCDKCIVDNARLFQAYEIQHRSEVVCKWPAQ